MRTFATILCLMLGSLGFAMPYTVVEDASGLAILTPSLQERKTKKLRLENGLEAYLISDPQIHESGAALSVGVGSWDDPESRPGMAHFVEHMLFLGTAKYPEEEGFQHYLDNHGGKRNAFTMSDRTVYMFSCTNSGFESALDRFADFFIAPLFTPSGVDRESRAIDSEFCKDVSLDPWRVLYVRKELGCAKHPFHTFCIGNKETLAQISRDELVKWFDTHYSAQWMHLAVYSAQPIEVLEKEVAERFSAVPVRATTPSIYEAPLLDPATAGKLVVIEPLQALQTLELTWEMPRHFGKDMDVRADELVSYVLGHEGENSLADTLKKDKLAEGLSAGCSRMGKDQCLFNISIDLTAEGLADCERVIALTFQAICKLRAQGIPAYLYDDLRQIKTLEYTYQERETPFEYVMELATDLVDEPLETFPRKTLMPTRFDQKSLDDFLAVLTPETCNFTLVAPVTEGLKVQKERWMGVVYGTRPFSPEILATWSTVPAHPTVAIPQPNPFLPKEIIPSTLIPTGEKSLPKPTLLCDDASGKVFYCRDDRFLVPEISWHFLLKTPLISDQTPRSHVLADLFCHAFSEKVSPLAYEAKLGGLTYSLEPDHNELEFIIQGYSAKAPEFLGALLKEMKNLSVSEVEFNLYKSVCEREYLNKLHKTPISEGMELNKSILYKDYSGPAAKSREITSVTYEEFRHFSHHLFAKCYLEGILYGDLTEESAKNEVLAFRETFCYKPYPKSEHPTVEMASLPAGKDPAYLVRKSDLPGNVLLLVADCGDFSFKRRAAHEILSKGIDEPFFSELRTKQQTGYVVANWTQEIERHLYSFFLVQSSTHETRDLLSRFELFFETFVRDFAATFPSARFESIKEALITNLEHPAEKLSSMGDLLFTLTRDYDGDFQWIHKRIEGVKSLSYDEFKAYTAEFLGKDNKRRLAICINGILDPQERLHYRRLPTAEKVRKEASYRGRESALAER